MGRHFPIIFFWCENLIDAIDSRSEDTPPLCHNTFEGLVNSQESQGHRHFRGGPWCLWAFPSGVQSMAIAHRRIQ